MSMFDAFKIYLFSEVNGVVTRDGQPVVGAEVIRSASYGKTYTDKATTDKEGRFFFSEMTISKISALVPGQHVIDQSIIIRNQDAEYKAWELTRVGSGPNAELDTQLSLLCELSNEYIKQEFNYKVFWGTCRLDPTKNFEKTPIALLCFYVLNNLHYGKFLALFC